MCCRYLLGLDYREKLNNIMEKEGITSSSQIDFEVGRDVRPSDTSTVIYGNGDNLTAANMRWGFMNPYKKGLIINARAETVKEKNLFADSIMKRRCLIPASGFYEWDPYKARFRFALPGDELILLAGFYREEQGIPRYTILTTEANESMKPIHDRMPVMIGRDEIRPWIRDNERLSEFLERPQMQLIRKQDSGQIRMDFGL